MPQERAGTGIGALFTGQSTPSPPFQAVEGDQQRHQRGQGQQAGDHGTARPTLARRNGIDDYWLLLTESHLTRRLFAAMVRRIAALPLPTG